MIKLIDEIPDAYDALDKGDLDFFIYSPNIRSKDNSFKYIHPIYDYDLVIYSGSFNPLHECHKFIYRKLQSEFYITKYPYKRKPFFEVSIERIGKEKFSKEKLIQILKQFEPGMIPNQDTLVLVTKSAKFIEKVGCLATNRLVGSNTIFVIGVDTYHRMIDHDGTNFIQGINATFWVVDRFIDGKFLTFSEITKIYHKPINCFPFDIKIPEEISKISSSDIRREMENNYDKF